MKNFLKIQSKGEIEIEAFTLIGASTKRSDATKIGFFGSGLKYSIAALIRNGIEFHIFQGEKEIEFSTIEKPFRNETFKAITVNGIETSLTTTMGGFDWDIAFAPIREIYSNAMDEDEDCSTGSSNQVLGTNGYTTIFIEETETVKAFIQNFNNYFCHRNPNVLMSNRYVSVYPAREKEIRLFRKGILCYDNNKTPALFQYNSEHFTINESRVLNSYYGAKNIIASGWKACTNPNLIREFIAGVKDGNGGLFEREFDFDLFEPFSHVWHEVLKDKKMMPVEMVMFASEEEAQERLCLPKDLLVPLFRQFQDLDVLGLSEKSFEDSFIPEKNPSDILQNKIIEAIQILNRTRYKNRLENPNIQIVNFVNKTTLGMANKGQILLSTKLDAHDVHSIAKIIIEENEHNRTEFEDETRLFQNHLFSLYYDELLAKIPVSVE